MTRAPVTSFLIMGLLMSFAVTTLAYGQHQHDVSILPQNIASFEFSEDQINRLVKANDTQFFFECPDNGNDKPVFMVDTDHEDMSQTYFQILEDLSCTDKTVTDITRDINQRVAAFIERMETVTSDNTVERTEELEDQDNN